MPLARRRHRNRGLPWISLAGPGVVQLLYQAQQLGIDRKQCWKLVRRLAIFQARGRRYYLAAWREADTTVRAQWEALRRQQHADRDAWQKNNLGTAQALLRADSPEPTRRTRLLAALFCTFGESIHGYPAHGAKPELLFNDYFSTYPSETEPAFKDRDEYDQLCDSARVLLTHIKRLERPAAEQAALGARLEQEVRNPQSGLPNGCCYYQDFIRSIDLIKTAILNGTSRTTIATVFTPGRINQSALTLAWAVAAAQVSREAFLSHMVADLADAVGLGRHERARGCGTVRTSCKGEKIVGVRTECKLKRNCDHCRSRFQVTQFRHLAAILLTLPVVYIVETTLDDEATFATRIRREGKRLSIAASYRRVEGIAGRVLMFTKVPVADSVAHTPEAAVQRLRLAIELIPRDVAKPIVGSRDWSIPKQPKQGYIDLGTGWGDDLNALARFLAEAGFKVGEHTTGGLEAIHAIAPEHYRSHMDEVASHLSEWFLIWREDGRLPPTFDLTQQPPIFTVMFGP